MTGYYGIGLENPSSSANVGSAMRIAAMYEAAFVSATGNRFDVGNLATAQQHHKTPLFRPTTMMESVPYDCVPVGIAYTHKAVMLPEYCHPERAFYIFSADDQELGNNLQDKCADIIRLPIMENMRLTDMVNVVLYDRVCKSWNSRREVE